MNPNDKPLSLDLVLRAQAEAQLANSQPPEVSVRPAEELLHELRVHQIELEMQNETLRLTQQALEKSRDRLVDLYEFAPLGYLTLTADGTIAEINLTAVALLWRERNTLLKRNLRSLVVSADQDKWVRHFTLAKAQAEKLSIELGLQRGDGRVFQAQLDCVRDPTGIRVALIDITERKTLDRLLRNSEAAFRTLFESSRDAIMTMNVGGDFLRGNPAAVVLFGCRDVREFLTQSPASVSPEFQPDGRKSDEKAQEMMRLARDTGSHFFEWTHRRMDGTEFFADVLLTRMEIGDKEMIQATVRDITKRKQAEAELRIAAAAFDSQVGMMIADANVRILRVKHAFTAITGYRPEEAIGKNPNLLSSGRQGANFYVAMWDSINSTGTWDGEIW
ncbi:MAG: PAS domain S-box protein, partial [Gallionella sp.]|nr:PAS domain S-box protein [Gallionella sp.]